jgi:PPOX class probable F420-dependent enzyme
VTNPTGKDPRKPKKRRRTVSIGGTSQSSFAGYASNAGANPTPPPSSKTGDTKRQLSSTVLDQLLTHWPVGRLATITADGSPHQVPVVFCREGDALYSPVDGKRKQGAPLKRLSNLAENPSFSLLLDDYQDDWQHLWWVRLDGTADVYSPPPEQLTELAQLFSAKYPQYENVGLFEPEPVCLRLKWNRTTAWAEQNVDEVVTAAIAALPAGA